MEDGEIYMYGKGAYIKRRPVWMLRWGTALLLGFFMSAIAFASIFSYNETIKAPVRLTTVDPPAHIRTKQSGRIIEVSHNPGDTVSQGDILGILENTGNARDIIALRKKLTSDHSLPLSLDAISEHFPSHLKVGNQIRPYYNRFLNAYYNLLLYRTLDSEELEGIEISRRLIGQTGTIHNKVEEIQVLQRGLEISESDFFRYQALFKKGVISLQELEIKETGYLKFRQEYGAMEEQLDHLRSERKGILNDRLLFNNSRLKNENVHVSNLELQKEELISELSKWEDQYLLKSPRSGRVSFFDVWGKHQNVEDGQVIFTIIPMGQMEFLGMCRVPFRNSGRIKAGQRVILKLESYPYREWGSVDGEVQIVSEVPKIGENEGYIVYITIKDLITSYGKSLEFKQEMVGSAEIILEEVTLLQRIFYQFRNLWSQTKI